MPDYFFDSSAIIKRYVLEVGTTWVSRLLDPSTGNQSYITRLTGVEVISAIARRRRGKSISSKDAAAALAQFNSDFSAEYFIIEITEGLAGLAMRLADTYELRGYDAVQLAAAVETNSNLLNAQLSPLILVSADRELNSAARAEGLTIEDPNAHP